MFKKTTPLSQADFMQHAGHPTLAEEIVAAEIAYFRQVDLCPLRSEEQLSRNELPEYAPIQAFATNCPLAIARTILERNGYSLHHYMARHLTPEAWSIWRAGSLLLGS
ncbi:hypothetical protein [Hymenobacter cellulosilyticus]|uniref:Uncharacterized protein n=1 Tax=Hymenobacter cellulosilyticus TaxID=2932248 RepID=A0A8T9QE62_9BACT|nr:hypothetical protein [Hymenobacter cellulosilyticus]UOQ74110.1 hypothetical protein MUN79_09580 [Hymenobacter cellulosilyticus]